MKKKIQGIEIQFIYQNRPASAYVLGNNLYFLMSMFHGVRESGDIKTNLCIEVNGRQFIREAEAVAMSSKLRDYLSENRYFLIRIASTFRSEMAFTA